jgi:UDP-GlcNAc:undecaprenyl-phosphate GlcNAc-1-phosphate transferase
VQLVSLPLGGSLAIGSPYMSLILTILAVVLVMNAVSFIDGLDGLVAGVAIVANGVFFVYSFVISITIGQTEYFNLAALISAVLIGACLGFLPLNWHPARLFMGDAGALLTGLLMATSAISVTGQIDPPRSRARRCSGVHPDPAAVRHPDRAAARLRPRSAAPRQRRQVAVHRRPQAPPSPAPRHGPLALPGGAHLLRLDGRRRGGLPDVPLRQAHVLRRHLPGVGLVSTAVTLAPLSRRKRVEMAVQTTSRDELQVTESDRFDPLDEAASVLDPADTDTAAQAAVPELSPPKEHP